MTERANGGYTVPQIFIGATHVGGCDDSTRSTATASSIRLLNDTLDGPRA